MSFFVYTAVDKNGKNTRGGTVAMDQSEVVRDIKSRELFPIEIREVSEVEFYKIKPGLEKRQTTIKVFKGKRIKTKQMVILLRDIASLVGAGVVITRTLDILSEQAHQGQTREVMKSLKEIVAQGHPFSEALKKYPGYFPPLISEMVSIGEKSGRLEEILNRLAIFYERQEEIESRFKQAMVYPIIIMSVAAMAVTIFLTVALPKIIKLYEDLNAELPGITLALIGASRFLQHYWMFVIAFFFFAGTFLRYLMRFENFRSAAHSVYMKVPVFGKLYMNVLMSRFIRALSAMYRSGFPIANSLQIMPQLVQNLIFQRAIQKVEASIRRGDGLANAFFNEKFFPRSVANIVFVGEESGTLDQNLDRIAERFEDEVDRTTKTLGTLIEPFFIVMMGGFVLFIALALFMPLVKIVTTLTNEAGGG